MNAGATSLGAGRASGKPRKELGTSGLTFGEWIGFLALVVGMFMSVLDIQIVASSLPEIQAGVSSSADEINWVQTGYLIAEVIMIPLSGFLSRALSTRVVFTVGAGMFTLMSLFCGLAQTSGQLVFLRVLQGFFGGTMIPLVFSTTFILFKGVWIGRISVVIGMMTTLAPSIGPSLGGWVTQAFGWHWLFLINVIPGALAAALVWFLFDIDKPDYALFRGFDTFGLLMMATFLGSLQYVVEEGPRQDWLDDDTVRLFAIVMVVAAVFFFWRVTTYHNPIVGLGAWLNRNFAIGSLVAVLSGVTMYGTVFLTPQFLALVRGYDSVQIGVAMLPMGLSQIGTATFVGPLLNRIDQRILLAIGLSLMTLGLWANVWATADWGGAELAIPQILRGSGFMFIVTVSGTMALGTLPLDKVKNASGLYNLNRNLGGAIGLAWIITMMRNHFNLHHARIADTVNAGDSRVQDMLAAIGDRADMAAPGDPASIGLKVVDGMISQQSMVMTFNDIYLAMAAMSFITLLLLLFVQKPKTAAAAAAAH